MVKACYINRSTHLCAVPRPVPTLWYSLCLCIIVCDSHRCRGRLRLHSEENPQSIEILLSSISWVLPLWVDSCSRMLRVRNSDLRNVYFLTERGDVERMQYFLWAEPPTEKIVWNVHVHRYKTQSFLHIRRPTTWDWVTAHAAHWIHIVGRCVDPLTPD